MEPVEINTQRILYPTWGELKLTRFQTNPGMCTVNQFNDGVVSFDWDDYAASPAIQRSIEHKIQVQNKLISSKELGFTLATSLLDGLLEYTNTQKKRIAEHAIKLLENLPTKDGVAVTGNILFEAIDHPLNLSLSGSIEQMKKYT